MTPARNLTLAATLAGLIAAAPLALADDAHHPKDAPKAAAPAPEAGKGMGMGGGMGMMGPDHMKKMQEMHTKMMGADGMMGGMAMGPKGDTGPSSQAYAAANARMHQGMTITFTGDADIDFAKGMIAHHQGAIDMAKVAVQYGKDPEIRKLAEAVIKAQEAEIALMTEWLKKKGQ
jgi:uncharacterized protein (DUF305 family)